jgi:hypothetical protein
MFRDRRCLTAVHKSLSLLQNVRLITNAINDKEKTQHAIEQCIHEVAVHFALKPLENF